MPFALDLWTRYESAGVPIYLRGDRPDWFVPTSPADALLQRLARNPDTPLDLAARLFLARLPDSPPAPYPGRAALLNTDHLRECWFHLTNRCNQSCRHCLFASSPAETAELAASRVLSLADEAAALGCRVFALTGGEPFCHPDFSRIVNHLLSFDQAHVVILTNGLLLDRYAESLADWPPARLHLQISLDGSPARHDAIRGPGAYDALISQLARLRGQSRTFTLSMCVEAGNVADMPAAVELAHRYGGTNVHFLWYFVRGRAQAARFAPSEVIFPHLVQAVRRAAELGVTIDNLESLRSQVFAPSGTIHDGPGSGWDSLAIGPDGKIYPSPALVGLPALATEITGSLAAAWRQSPILEEIRRQSTATSPSPCRFLLGGGDLDHSYLHGGTFLGSDPYQPLSEQLAWWLIAQEAQPSPDRETLGLRLKMGESVATCGAIQGVALTHHNCLLAAAQPGGIDAIKAFYQEAALTEKTDILNPIAYPEDFIAHIPPPFRFRGYGCGSPVLAAGLQPGECVLDLGCGRGVECFIAAPLVGPKGKVYGVDMLAVMLAQARAGAAGVAANLGYANLEFKSGYLEELPLEDDAIDVALSNCVINLSTRKRRTFAEIFRVLRPGGRLVIADVVCDTDPPAALKHDEVLRDECLAGAMTQKDLFGLLRDTGFGHILARTRFPYRQVQGQQFYSLTYSAVKPDAPRPVRVMYRGPLAAGVTGQGDLLPAGVSCALSLSGPPPESGDLYVLDAQGAVLNQSWEAPACCLGSEGCGNPAGAAARPHPHLPPGCCPTADCPDGVPAAASGAPAPCSAPAKSGCLVCGAPLLYPARQAPARCVFCHGEHPASAVCQHGHFVCDTCHSRDALAVIEHHLLTTKETDMVALLRDIRHHPALPRHGPEHHSLVPGIILAACRQAGGPVTPEMLRTALTRGTTVAGGACAFQGVCGAAAGVGIAFSLLLGANPIKPRERQTIKQITLAALQSSSELGGARCCQQECWLALRQAAKLSSRYLPVTLTADHPLICEQWRDNRECLGAACPLWPGKRL